MIEKKIKILNVVNISFVLPYYIGDQFDYFNKLGISNYVACTPSAHFFEYSFEKNFHTIPINILRKIDLLEDFKAIYYLRKKIIEERIDIVIGHTPKGALIAMVASYLAKVKYRIYFRHGLMYETSKGMKKLILKSIERFTGFISTKVVCVSNSVLKQSITENLNEISKNLILNIGTCNGIDTKRFSRDIKSYKIGHLRDKYKIKSTDKVIGYVGRIVNDKGITELILAWKIVIKKYPNLKLLLVGPFEERDSINSDMKLYIENCDSIILIGLIKDVIPYYCLMNIFILPSYREGFPTVVLEASSMELPVITTKSTGCIDSIIENETGIFCEIDPNSISNKISFYLDNLNLAYQHGQNGRNFVVKNFQQEIIWKEIATKVYELNL